VRASGRVDSAKLVLPGCLSQGTELIFDSIWHTTDSQVTCNWHSSKT